MLRREHGVALLVVLVISAVALIVMSGLAYLLTAGSTLSGMSKRYQSAHEAGKAGAGIVYQLIDARGNPNVPLANFTIPDTARLFAASGGKLTTPTASWLAGSSSTVTITTSDTTTYDFRFDLGVNPTYRVYAKITDTVQGNSGTDPALHKHGVVANSAEIAMPPAPFLYAIEIVSEDAGNPQERAKLSTLYEY
jgi:hypothetical protein